MLIDRPVGRGSNRTDVTSARRTRSGAATTRRRSRSRRLRALRPRPVDAAQRRDARRGRAPAVRRLPPAPGDDRVPHRGLPAVGARPPVQPVLLDEHRRPRGRVRRAGRAHELRRAGALWRAALRVSGQLRRAGPRAAGARRRRAAGALRALAAAHQPGLRPLVGARALAVPRAGRAADRHRRLREADPAAADRRPGPRPGQHDPDLSRGPRHELRGPPRRPGSGRAAPRTRGDCPLSLKCDSEETDPSVASA